MGGLKSRVRCYGEDKNLFPLMGLVPRFLGSPVRSLVTILTELIRLLMTNGHRQVFICIY
jgi:hypothetical protein